MKHGANESSNSIPAEPHSRPVNMPDFIVFGTGKSGTTAFHKALSRHPRIFCSIPKEPNFFAYPEKGNHRKGADSQHDIKIESDYQSMFSHAHQSQIRGEASIGYLKYNQVPQRIHQSIPNVKLIAILRHPVDRAYSAWLHHRHNFNEPIADFVTACEAGRERTESGWSIGRDYLNTGYYARHLKRWFSVFPRNQFKIFIYEDWLHNPTKVLRETFQFLGIPPDDFITVTRDNVTSIRPRSIRLHSFLNPGQKLRTLVQRILPDSVRIGTTRFLRRINSGQSAPLDPTVRAKLTAQYRDDISELEKLINRDLTHWQTTPQSSSNT